jgi:hypothetical protein
MNSATTLPDAASVPVRAPRLLGFYLLLIIVAAIEAIAFGISVFLHGC